MSNIASLRDQLRKAKKSCNPIAASILAKNVQDEERRIVREADYSKAFLMGRCCDGRQADAGHLIHALPKTYEALCGVKYGRRSAGWQDAEADGFALGYVNCPKCLAKIKRYATTAPAEEEVKS